MKLFIILSIIVGVYFWGLLSTTDMVMDQTMQLHQRYAQTAELAEDIASGKQ